MDEEGVPNYQMVGTDGLDQIVIMAPRFQMTKKEALQHAAWLVVLADPLDETFPFMLEAVRNT